jgi:DNA processing protein
VSVDGPSRRRAPGACARCLRRSWLLASLGGPLEYCARDRGRLSELLALADDELLQALAGRRLVELRARFEHFQVGELARAAGVETICRHRRGYPSGLAQAASPHMLAVAGDVARLVELASSPVVAIVGSRAASDYGMEMARSFARGLAASGVTVAASLSDGIAIAAHAGALDAGGASIAVMGGGLGVSCPARRRSLYDRVKRAGCAVSELPFDCAGRRWGQLAGERIVVELAQLTVLVEAQDTPGELAGARTAQALGRAVAAIPGRVTSPLSRGTHALLMDGASLIRDPADALELLYARTASSAAVQPRRLAGGSPTAGAGPGRRLTAMLERVGAGEDTPDKLTREGTDAAEVLLALSELELLGLLARGDGGRYVPRAPLATSDGGCAHNWIRR